MRVRATKQCSVAGHRRREGAVFNIDPEQFSKNYMEKVGGETAPVETKSVDWNKESIAALKEELGRRGVPFPASANKAVLVTMLEEADGGARPVANDGDDEEGGEDLT